MVLTVVTATFNCLDSGSHDCLLRCVESVASIKTEHEHLVYDGASKDGTAELLFALEKEIPTLKVVSEPDTGIYNALNKGVRDAKGEWFYVLGADDYICAPNVLDNLLGNAAKETMVMVSPVERERENRFYRKLPDMAKIFWTVPCSHQGIVMRTKLVRGCGGFDEKKYEICADWDMMLKAHEMGAKHHYTFQPYAFYGVGGMSENGDGRGSREVKLVLQNHLGLTDAETQRLAKDGVCPVTKMMPYLLDRDLAFRMGARRMILRSIKYWIRRIIAPLGSMTRLRRHWFV